MNKRLIEIIGIAEDLLCNEIVFLSLNMSTDVIIERIDFLRKLLEELRDISIISDFTIEEEISLFKEMKPFVLSKLIYYSDIYLLELRKPNGSKEVLMEYYKKQQTVITEFCSDNLDFYQYYRSKSTHLDQYYFLRGYDNYQLYHNFGAFDKDPLFSTCCDHIVAKILAYDMLEIFLQLKIENVGKIGFIFGGEKLQTNKSIRWTASKIDATELGYALYAAGVFDNGNAEIKEIMTYIEQLFNIDLGDYYRTYFTMRGRKKDKTPFLANLINEMVKKMDEDDNLK